MNRRVYLCNLGKPGFRKSFPLPVGEKELQPRDLQTHKDKIIVPARILITRAF